MQSFLNQRNKIPVRYSVIGVNGGHFKLIDSDLSEQLITMGDNG